MSEFKDVIGVPGLSPTLQDIFKKQEERNRSFIFDSLEKVSRMRVTTMQEIEVCPARWKNSLGKPRYKEVEEGKKDYAMIGTLCHLYVENHISEKFLGVPTIDKGVIVELLELLFVETPEELGNLTAYCTRLSKKFSGWKLIATEMEVKIPANIPLPVYGQVDAVFQNPVTGEYCIVDHKTNRRPDRQKDWQKKLQILSYQSAICAKYAIKGCYFFLGKVNLKEDHFFWTDDPFREVSTRYNDIYETIMRDASREQLNNECKYCQVRATCRRKLESQEFLQLRPWLKSKNVSS